jgi:trans-aconitate methyltransferase
MQEKSAFSLLNNIRFKKNDNILDIGCGDGKITAQLSKCAPKGITIGLDISENMIQYAQKTFTLIPNLSFIQADANNFALPQKFDYVTSFYAMHWVKNLQNSLTCIYNVLNPGGKVFIKIATMHNDCPIQNYFNSLNPNGKWAKAKKGRKNTFHGSKTVKEFETFLKKAGFKNYKITILYESFNFKNFNTFVSWFLGWGVYCTQLSITQARAFFEEMVAQVYKQQFKKHNEEIIYTFPILQAEAEKT